MKEITVCVVYASAERATEIIMRLSAGASVAEAIARSRIAELHPEVDFTRAPTGIYGRKVDRSAALADGDRVEIYRPLAANPKDVRRRRARRRADG
ncbi:MAG TPA: RnfH family protein [Casimicrobiaceae bacterium]|nr:RnfH family protein [Casimicrobiaceae bacterium]